VRKVAHRRKINGFFFVYWVKGPHHFSKFLVLPWFSLAPASLAQGEEVPGDGSCQACRAVASVSE
jgi:hypothetical protein